MNLEKFILKEKFNEIDVRFFDNYQKLYVINSINKEQKRIPAIKLLCETDNKYLNINVLHGEVIDLEEHTAHFIWKEEVSVFENLLNKYMKISIFDRKVFSVWLVNEQYCSFDSEGKLELWN